MGSHAQARSCTMWKTSKDRVKGKDNKGGGRGYKVKEGRRYRFCMKEERAIRYRLQCQWNAPSSSTPPVSLSTSTSQTEDRDRGDRPYDFLVDPIDNEVIGSDKRRIRSGHERPDTDGHEVRQVDTVQVRNLGSADNMTAGLEVLSDNLQKLATINSVHGSGLIRLEVVIPCELDILGWLKLHQPIQNNHPQSSSANFHPILYFSPRTSSYGEGLHNQESSDDNLGNHETAIGCIGSACMWKGLPGTKLDKKSFGRIKRFMSKDHDNVRAFGGIRFDPLKRPSEEWEEFGSYMFIIPAVELASYSSHSTICCTVAWDNSSNIEENENIKVFTKALENVEYLLKKIQNVKDTSRTSLRLDVDEVSQNPSFSIWQGNVSSTVDNLVEDNTQIGFGSGQNEVQNRREGKMDSMDYFNSDTCIDVVHNGGSSLRKVVLARQTRANVKNQINALHFLSCLQDKDRRGYQFGIMLGDGKAFFGSTPERLYARNGMMVISEAVAATSRSSSNQALNKDLLLSEKEHNEFVVVREAVRKALGESCTQVKVEVEKEIIKHVSVQHLYGRLSAKLDSDKDDFHLLSTLHPTPAVAGYPSVESLQELDAIEDFDRGFYSGPFGWFSASSAEFAVAIRSALVEPISDSEHKLLVYAGVGLVSGSRADMEWKELDLKIQQFGRLMEDNQTPIHMMPNRNTAVATLVVEELCRLGVKYFCIAPGSRSTPLVLAASKHPRAQVITCIDERSLGFFALGVAKGSRVPAAIITTSGTAVANLFPSVIEACESGVPMFVLTADRPAEFHGTGANQTIDQKNIYGNYVRWFQNFASFSEQPLRTVLTNLSTAWRYAFAGTPGPVHLNFEFREPLAPTIEEWDKKIIDERVQVWEKDDRPFVSNIIPDMDSPFRFAQLENVMHMLTACKKGLVIAGTSIASSEHLSVLKIAQHLRWPLVPDISSGLKLGIPRTKENSNVIFNFDQALLHEGIEELIQPEIIIQVGKEPVSKRISSFIQKSCADGKSKLVILGSNPSQRDPSHLGSHQLLMEPSTFAKSISWWLSERENAENGQNCLDYSTFLVTMDKTVSHSIEAALEKTNCLSEPHVARAICTLLPGSHTLFLGNSMPIRDMEFYCGDTRSKSSFSRSISSNRGSSGIDGLVSTASGFAESSGSPLTLLLGDVSFLHDCNGMNFLSGIEASKRTPVTIIVINNGGGRIFEMLPVANTVDDSTMESCFVTNPEAKISSLCDSYNIPYQAICDLKDADEVLGRAWSSHMHNVVEIFVNPDRSKEVRKEIKETVKRDVRLLHQNMGSVSHPLQKCAKITSIDCTKVSYPLARNLTTSSTNLTKDLIKVRVHMSIPGSSDGVICAGEVSPLPGLHKESFVDAQSQTLCIMNVLKNRDIPFSLGTMNGCMSDWFKHIGVDQHYLFPSVQFGIQSIIVQGLSMLTEQSLSEYLGANQCGSYKTNVVSLCGLLSSCTSVEDALEEGKKLVRKGYKGIKVKVGRHDMYKVDADIVKALREEFGPDLVIRCDANRGWSLEEALAFAEDTKHCNIEFIEEPVNSLKELCSFCTLTDMPVALDESLTLISADILSDMHLSKITAVLKRLNGSLYALVLKPSILGSMEAFKALVGLCCDHKILPIVSATFESSIGMASLTQMAAYANSMFFQANGYSTILHGLGTIEWNAHEPFDTRIGLELVRPHINEPIKCMGFDCGSRHNEELQEGKGYSAASRELYNSEICSLVTAARRNDSFMTLQVMNSGSAACEEKLGTPFFFLHGFLGMTSDWMPLMAALSAKSKCYGVSLPGHHPSAVVDISSMSKDQTTIDFTCDTLKDLISDSGEEKPMLVGYSMGARLALEMILDHPDRFSGAVIISGSPGINDKGVRATRARRDMMLSTQLEEGGLENFVENWYQQGIFTSFKDCPEFEESVDKRCSMHSAKGLASALTGLSPGLQQSLWSKLKNLSVPVLFLAGKLDKKYASLAKEMYTIAKGSPLLQDEDVLLELVEDAGHALHIESPEAIVAPISRFALHIESRTCNNNLC